MKRSETIKIKQEPFNRPNRVGVQQYNQNVIKLTNFVWIEEHIQEVFTLINNN